MFPRSPTLKNTCFPLPAFRTAVRQENSPIEGESTSAMKVTQVGIRPTEDSLRAGRPSLTPELLAASGARYSRNNEGLEAILSKIDPENLDKSVDSIFRMIDYGH